MTFCELDNHVKDVPFYHQEQTDKNVLTPGILQSFPLNTAAVLFGKPGLPMSDSLATLLQVTFSLLNAFVSETYFRLNNHSFALPSAFPPSLTLSQRLSWSGFFYLLAWPESPSPQQVLSSPVFAGSPWFTTDYYAVGRRKALWHTRGSENHRLSPPSSHCKAAGPFPFRIRIIPSPTY